MKPWVILGSGYIGSRLARALLADGERVIACSRNRDQLAALEQAGAEIHPFQASGGRAFRHALGAEQRAIVVYALPLLPGIPPGDVVNRAVAAALRVGAERFVYLSSTAIYGEGHDGRMVDEDTSPDLEDLEARAYLGAEGAIHDARANGLDSIMLRLAPVYGPGRGVRERLLDGTYKLVDEGAHVFSRVHVDDVVGVIRAAVARAPASATYCVADDGPCPQKEHTDWLCAHLGLRPPPSVPSLAPGQPRHRIRNRAVSNARLKRELDYAMIHPSYVEGEAAIDQELGRQPEATPAGASAPPLVIHRGSELGAVAERSGLRRLAVRHEELAAGAASRLSAPGEGLVWVLAGALDVSHGSDTHRVEAGDVIEMPAGGLQVESAGSEPARVLVLGTRA